MLRSPVVFCVFLRRRSSILRSPFTQLLSAANSFAFSMASRAFLSVTEVPLLGLVTKVKITFNPFDPRSVRARCVAVFLCCITPGGHETCTCADMVLRILFWCCFHTRH